MKERATGSFAPGRVWNTAASCAGVNRAQRGEAPARRPGPAKVEPLDMELLVKTDRSHAPWAGAVRMERMTFTLSNKNAISRRDLNALVKAERDHQKEIRASAQYRIEWHVPRLVWAMDDTEYRPDPQYPKAYLNNVQDLGSRYKFGALVGLHLASGKEVVTHLTETIQPTRRTAVP